MLEKNICLNFIITVGTVHLEKKIYIYWRVLYINDEGCIRLSIVLIMAPFMVFQKRLVAKHTLVARLLGKKYGGAFP